MRPNVEDGLSRVALPDLEHLLAEVTRGGCACPITSAGLAGAGLGPLTPALAMLKGLGAEAVSIVLSAVIAERRRHTAKVDLVWTGPEMPGSVSRDTAVVVWELFESAAQRVLVAGFWFFNAAEILAPLHAAMRDRKVEASIFLHLEPAKRAGLGLDAHVEAQVDKFLRFSWPFGHPVPNLFYSPDAVAGEGILHAKCIVVDDARAFVSSANFTESAQSRNIEVGALIDDGTFSRNLVAQWRRAAEAGFFRQCGP